MTDDAAEVRARYLAAYDQELRITAETQGATSVEARGPLRLVRFPGGQGFVTYRNLGEVDEAEVRRLVLDAVSHFAADPEIVEVEWKSRSHDRAPGLNDALISSGFVRQDEESIMVGEAHKLAVDVPLPTGVALRRVTSEPDVRRMGEMQDEVFGGHVSSGMVEELLHQMASRDGSEIGVELWVAEARGEIVSAGRLELVAGTRFAGIWGGATRTTWRGKGIYRALTAVRARSALDRGKTMLYSDSTEYSRPILERSSLVRVSTTTPYLWTRTT